ncbi:MAG: hypothetical protein AAF196_13905 [Planctomycetota bacterium]
MSNTIYVDSNLGPERSIGARMLGSGLAPAARAMFESSSQGMPKPTIDTTLLLNDQAPAAPEKSVEVLTAENLLQAARR